MINKIIDSFKNNPRRSLICLIAIAMGVFHLYTSGVRPLPAIQQRIVHLTFALILTFLIFPLRGSKKQLEEEPNKGWLKWLDTACVLLSLGMGIYVLQQYNSIIFRLAYPTFLDSAVSLLAIILVLEATRRMIGMSVIIICLCCFAYLAGGQYLPSFLAHPGFTFERVVNFMFLTTEGILGTALGVSATVIVIFILFGAFIDKSGAGPLFTEGAYSLFGGFRGGPAKAAVVGSTLFGMITGSQTANVSAVGVFTIPLMKRVGYTPVIAGAIEAVASTGAMIMPPVMGAVAFIIPEILGCTYWDVVKANLIPALLFYVALYVFVEVQSGQLGIKRVARSELPNIKKLLKDRIHMIIPVLVLIYFLGIVKASPTRSAFWGIVAAVVVSLFRKTTRMTISDVGKAIEQGAKGSLIVANACASAGIITGVIAMSGLGLRFSDILVTFAGGSLILLLLLTMMASLIIGLPLPPVSCYLVLAVLAVPAMVRLGVEPMAAHLFVFFFGTMGNISPPVAPTSFASAGLAGSDPFKTTNLAFLISLPTYLVPFLFVYSPELLLYGSFFGILKVVFTAFIGLSCMAICLQGWFITRLSWLSRFLALAAGITLVVPSNIAKLIGFSLCGALLFYWLAQRKKEVKTLG